MELKSQGIANKFNRLDVDIDKLSKINLKIDLLYLMQTSKIIKVLEQLTKKKSKRSKQKLVQQKERKQESFQKK